MMKKFVLPKSAKGQSLVELAISLVILLYLLSGAVEFGILFFQYVQLRDAAQEGALYGSTCFNADDPPADCAAAIETRARASSPSTSPLDLNSAEVTIAITIDGVPSTDATGFAAVACEGHGLEVRVSYTHKIFMPFIPQLIGRTSIPLNATVTDTILTPFDTATCTPPP